MLNKIASSSGCVKCTYNGGVSRIRSRLELVSYFVSSLYNDGLCRHFNSKTTPRSSLVPVPADKSEDIEMYVEPQQQLVPHFSGYDIRELDPDVRIKLESVSSELARAQASALINPKGSRRRREILRMDEEDYKDTAIGQKRAPLLDRRGEAQSFFMRAMAPDKRNNIDVLSFVQADIDLRPKSLKRWWAKLETESNIKDQLYNPKRNQILGNELAAAHFIVARNGKVKFLGQKDWVTTYRKDAKPGVADEDLPVMTFEKCTLPVNYDPKFRVEGIDATGVQLYFEGLANFENLNYLKWLSLRDSPFIDDWCLDKLARLFHDKLEFLDLSGCKSITDKGIGTLHRCKKLKVLAVENLPHLENLEIVCAMLEEHNPTLEVVGVDYVRKTENLRLEGEELERKALEAEASEDESSEKPTYLIEEPASSIKITNSNSQKLDAS